MIDQEKKTMKKSLLILSAATCFLTGCTFTDPVVPPKPAPLPPPKENPPVAPARVVTRSFSITSAIDTKMRVNFEYASAEQKFCGKLAARLAEEVMLDKAELVTQAPYDATVRIVPEFELVDQTGDFYRVNCKEVRFTIVTAGKLLGLTTVTPAALPRKRGLDNAKEQYLKAVAEKAAAFVSKKFDVLTATQLGITNVTFKIAGHNTENTISEFSKRIDRLNDVLKKTQGISNYQIISQDIVKGECTFRVVYMKEKFKHGIINALSVELDRLNSSSQNK